MWWKTYIDIYIVSGEVNSKVLSPRKYLLNINLPKMLKMSIQGYEEFSYESTFYHKCRFTIEHYKWPALFYQHNIKLKDLNRLHIDDVQNCCSSALKRWPEIMILKEISELIKYIYWEYFIFAGYNSTYNVFGFTWTVNSFIRFKINFLSLT